MPAGPQLSPGKSRGHGVHRLSCLLSTSDKGHQVPLGQIPALHGPALTALLPLWVGPASLRPWSPVLSDAEKPAPSIGPRTLVPSALLPAVPPHTALIRT